MLEALQGWQEDNETGATDPYNSWFATVLFSHILQNNPRAKSIALAITFGDEENGRLFIAQYRLLLIGSAFETDACICICMYNTR